MLVSPSELAEFQALAESQMIDTATAKRLTGTAYDPESQGQVATYSTLFTDERCKVQTVGLVPATSEVGGFTATEVRVRVDLPVSTTPLQPGDVIDVTPGEGSTSAATSYRVTAPFEGTHKTARRYAVERVV